MHKHLALILFHCFILMQAHAQSFDEICLQAKSENKVILLVVESEDCFHCNEVNRSGLSSPSLQKMLKEDAILYYSYTVPDNINKQEDLFDLPYKFAGIIFLDGDKHIISTYSGATSNYNFYEFQLKQAIREKKRGKNDFTELSDNFINSKKTFCDTYSLIEKIMQKGLEPKQFLVDTLVQLAPTDSLRSLTFLQFLYKTAPEVGSLTEKLATQNRDNSEMAWWRMPTNVRVGLNSRMLKKSLKKAIIKKDKNYAYDVASSAAYRTGETGNQTARNGSLFILLQFFDEIKDTLSFTIYVKPYIESFYKVKVDSIIKIDSANRDQLKRETEQNKRIYNAQTIAVFRVNDYQSLAMRYAIILNNTAKIILSFSKNQQNLNDALNWAKKANELFLSPDFMDTYARLLYKTNHKNLAVEWETKAIELMKSKDKNTQLMELVLEKMKNEN